MLDDLVGVAGRVGGGVFGASNSEALLVHGIGVVSKHYTGEQRGLVVEAVVELQAEIRAVAAVNGIFETEAVHVGGAHGRALEIHLRHILGHVVVAIGNGEIDAEILLLAEHLGGLHSTEEAAQVAERFVIHAGGIGETTAVQGERRLRNHVHRAADGIGVHVGRWRLDDLDAVDVVSGQFINLEATGLLAAGGTGEARAIERHGAVGRAHPAHEDLIDLALVEIGGDAGNAFQHLADVAIDEFAERVGGDDALHVIGVALARDRGGAALAFAGDSEGGELIDRRAQADGRHRVPPRSDGERLRVGVETRIGDLERVVAGRHAREFEATVAIRERGLGGAEERDLRAGEEAARGGIAHAAGDGGLRERRRDNCERQCERGQKPMARSAEAGWRDFHGRVLVLRFRVWRSAAE